MKVIDQIASLQRAIDEATKTLLALQNVVTPEGWSAVRANGTPPTDEQLRFASRHGCEWNDKEDRDLVTKWMQFASIETLARTHRRTEGSVRSELQRLLYAANINVILDELCGKE